MSCRVVVAFVLALASGVVAGCGGSGARSQQPVAMEEDTTLGSGDVFDVRVYGEQELSGTYRVTQQGTIDFPFIGRTEVAGLEPNDIADLVSTRLREGGFVRSPQVSIFVREYNSKRVSVMGAVSHPGTFPLTSGLTVVQAISAAGGFTPLASGNRVVVTRRMGGRVQRYAVQVEEITDGAADDFPLRPGDIVYVPERLF